MISGKKSVKKPSLSEEFKQKKEVSDGRSNKASIFSKGTSGSIDLTYTDVNIHIHETGSVSYVFDFHGDAMLHAANDELDIELTDTGNAVSIKDEFNACQSAVQSRVDTASLTPNSPSGTIDLTFEDMNIHIAKTGNGSLHLDIEASATLQLDNNNVRIEIHNSNLAGNSLFDATSKKLACEPDLIAQLESRLKP